MRTFERGTKANETMENETVERNWVVGTKEGGQRKRSLCNASTNENLIRSFNLPDDSTCGLINLG